MKLMIDILKCLFVSTWGTLELHLVVHCGCRWGVLNASIVYRMYLRLGVLFLGNIDILWVYNALWNTRLYINLQQGHTYLGDYKRIGKAQVGDNHSTLLGSWGQHLAFQMFEGFWVFWSIVTCLTSKMRKACIFSKHQNNNTQCSEAKRTIIDRPQWTIYC